MSGGEADYTPIVLPKEELIGFLRRNIGFHVTWSTVERWIKEHDVTMDWL